jgi:hypothetical protein
MGCLLSRAGLVVASGGARRPKDVEVVDVGSVHDLPEAAHAPRPCGRYPAVVEIPAVGSGDPRGLGGGLDPVGLEPLGGGRRSAQRAGSTLPDRFDQLEYVVGLRLGHVDEGEVPDRPVGPVE